MRFAYPLPLVALLTWPMLGVAKESASIPSGPSFRVETELFEGDSVLPAARHLILFDSGVIYDLRLDDDRIATMYDPARGRVILIDRARSQHTVVSTETLLSASAQLRAAIMQEDKAGAFGLDAPVVTVPVETAGQSPILRMSYGDIQYQTTVQSVKDSAIPDAYQQFAVIAAQLNIVRRVGVAPFGRLALGEQIAKNGQLPLETTLEIRSGLRKERYRSHLLVVEQLSSNDRDRINDLGRVLAGCKEVPLEQFGR